VHGADGRESDAGRGLFAAALLAGMPELPVKEEGRLNDPVHCARFLARVRAMARRRIGGR
jgi:hypothetical protein